MQHQQIIIVGAQKSGTSSLFKILGSNPEICAAETKEPAIFCKNRGNRKYKRNIQTAYPDYSGERYCLEASTAYTIFPECSESPVAIFNALVNPKIIYIVRDPIQRVISQYNYEKLQRGKKFSSNITDSRYISPSLYLTQISRYEKFFNIDGGFLILAFEKFCTDPIATLDEIADFLSVNNVFSFENTHSNATQLNFVFRTLDIFGLRPILKRNLSKAANEFWANVANKYSPKIRLPRWQDDSKLRIYQSVHDDAEKFLQRFPEFRRFWKTYEAMRIGTPKKQ